MDFTQKMHPALSSNLNLSYRRMKSWIGCSNRLWLFKLTSKFLLKERFHFRKHSVSTFWIHSSRWICGVAFTIDYENFDYHFTDFLLLQPFFPITNPKKGWKRKGEWMITILFPLLSKALQSHLQMQRILCLSEDILFEALKDTGRKSCGLLLAPFCEAAKLLYTDRSPKCTCKNERNGNSAYVYRIKKMWEEKEQNTHQKNPHSDVWAHRFYRITDLNFRQTLLSFLTIIPPFFSLMICVQCQNHS